MSTLQVATIKAATIGTPTGRGGGAKTPSPADCMKDCIAWYSPKRQGITNEYLQDHYLDDDAVLQDLSDNGNHIALHNMEGEEGGGYVNDDGDLVFDGVDDMGESVKLIQMPTQGVSVAMFVDMDTEVSNGSWWDFSSSITTLSTMLNFTRANATTFRIGYYPNTYGQFTVRGTEPTMTPFLVSYYKGEDAHVWKPAPNNFANYAMTNKLPYDMGDTSRYLFLGQSRNGFASYRLRELLFFNRELTREEAEWVYTNILGVTNSNS